MIWKAEKEGFDYELALQVFRTSTVDHKIPSPDELLHGRKMQSNLPVKIHHSNDPVIQQLQHRQDTMHKKCHEQQIRVLDQKSKKWVPATVSRVCLEPRSYDSHTRQCDATSEPPPPQFDSWAEISAKKQAVKSGYIHF